MKKRPQIIIYILLNIFISAATILLVMWLWDRSHPAPILVTEPDSPISAASDSDDEFESNPTTDFISEDFDVEIRTIVGAGDLEIEYVQIVNTGEGGADLTGWQLVDDDGQVYTFPTILLNSSGDIKVLSQKGMDTVIELYWQSDEPIWEPGETAQLLDETGTIISTYSIP